jgi:predicted nucleic acid-binding protein
MIAVDTNVLIGAIQTFDLQLERLDATRQCQRSGILSRAGRSIRGPLSDAIATLPETPEILPTWRKLVLEHRVAGIQVHDARIVAAMRVHRVNTILSFDLDDFTRYEGIAVVHPTEVK